MNHHPRLARAENRRTVTHKAGTTDDIIAAVVDVYNDSYDQVDALAQSLRRGSVRETCREIFETIDDHTTYILDPFRKQLIKTPARFWSDGFGDCKSFAIFICSCLRCLAIPHCFRFASYTLDSSEPTHVYAVAIDENGNEIPVDPVYKIDGIGQFGKEVDYCYKKDMRGTTEISRLSGIGYPGYQAEITRLPEQELTRQQQDLLINLNILQIYEEGKAKRADELKQIRNRIDVALLALMAYQSGYPESVVTPEQMLSALVLMIEGGRFDLPVGLSEEERDQERAILFGDMVTIGKGIADVNPDAYKLIYACTAGDLVAQLSGIGAATDVPSEDQEFDEAYRKNFRNAKAQGNIAEIQKNLREGAEYFMYCFIPESELSNYPEAVTTKRREHEAYMKEIQKSGCMTVAQVKATLNAQLTARWGSPEIFLAGVKNGNIPVESASVGVISATVAAIIIAVVTAVIAGIFALLEKMLGGNSYDAGSLDAYAPSMDDGFIYNDANPSFGTGGNDLTRAGSTLSKFLPFVLIGAVLLLPSGKKKKKK